MWVATRNSVEAAAATLIGAIVAYIFFLPDSPYWQPERIAEQQLSAALFGAIVGALVYYGWRIVTKSL